MWTYEKTHPWIKYILDLRKIDSHLWIKFGEITAICKHIKGIPIRPKTAQKLHWLFFAKGVQGTTAIEGNTLSEQEVLDRIQGKLTVQPSKKYQVQEIDNIVKACNLIGNKVINKEINILSVKHIKEYNRLVLEKLPIDKGVIPGQIRNYENVIRGSGYKGAPYQDCEYLLNRMCEWLNKDFSPPDNELLITYGLLKAIIAHLYLAWIHPFGDGNGRTARLVEFQLLLSSGLPTPVSHLLSNFYNQTRPEYYRQLVKSSQSGGDIIPFIEYAVQGFLDELNTQLEVIHLEQLDTAWRNYIQELFYDKTNKRDIRQMNLVLDLSLKNDFVLISKIDELSPRLAKAYAYIKTSRTINRDIKELIQMGLIEKKERSIRAKKEIILAFLPEFKFGED